MTLYETRWEFIRPYVEGKDVLDLGPAELVGTLNRDKIDHWVHGQIAKVASKLVGLEYSQQQVDALSAMGYNIQQGDAQKFDLGEQFDVIVAGELIEHLSNPGLFLDCVHRHLKAGGTLVLTTPNRYSITMLYKVLRTAKIPQYKKPLAKHVLYFDSDSLTSLLDRHDFEDVEVGYGQWVGKPKKKGMTKSLVVMAQRFRPVMLPVLLVAANKPA